MIPPGNAGDRADGRGRPTTVHAACDIPDGLVGSTHEKRVGALSDAYRRVLRRGDHRIARELFDCYLLIAGLRGWSESRALTDAVNLGEILDDLMQGPFCRPGASPS